MQIELLKILPNTLISVYSPIWLVIYLASLYQAIIILIKIDDLISNKLNNRRYIKTFLSSTSVLLKKLLSTLQKSLQLPDEIEPLSKIIPISIKRFGVYIESSIWFTFSILTTTYFILIALLTLLTVKQITFFNILIILSVSTMLILCSIFLYIEGRKSLLRARKL